jgi:hypothetical protein
MAISAVAQIASRKIVTPIPGIPDLPREGAEINRAVSVYTKQAA